MHTVDYIAFDSFEAKSLNTFKFFLIHVFVFANEHNLNRIVFRLFSMSLKTNQYYAYI